MIKNERGSLLVYTIFLVLIISVLTLPLLNISSARNVHDLRDKNQLLANSFVVSISEEFLSYLQRYSRSESYTKLDHLKLFYGGIPDAANRKIVRLTQPDGSIVTYSIYYSPDSSKPTNYLVTAKVVAGDTNGNLIADEKFSFAKEIIYEVDTSMSFPIIVEDKEYFPKPGEEGQRIYIGGTSNHWDDNHYLYVNELMMQIDQRLESKVEEEIKKVNAYKSNPIICNNCSLKQIQDEINASSNNPVIIQAGDLIVNDNKANITFGSPTKRVVLILNSFTSHKKTTVNVYGDMIVNNLTGNSDLDFNSGISSSGSNLWVTGTLTLHSESNINAGETIFANNIIANNKATLSSNNIIVANNFIVHGNHTTLNATDEIITGNLTVSNHANLTCNAGDFFVKGNLTAHNHFNITSGGNIAVGGNFTINQPKHFDYEIGGGYTALNPVIWGGGGGSGSNAIAPWNPKRK